MALPLALVACKPDAPVDEVKNPTVDITAGEATENSLKFTVSSTEATDVAWMYVEATEETPAAAAILKAGNVIEANKEVECLANALEEDTEYTIVAVAKNAAGAVTKEIQMSTKKLDPQTSSIKLKSGEASFKAEGGKGTIEYEIINAVPNGKFSHACKDTWVKDIKTGETSATFTVEANEGEAREAIITIFYEDAKAEFKVKQAAKAADDGKDDGKDDGEDDGKDDGNDDVVADVEFTAKELYLEYLDMVDDSVAYNYYVVLSDVPTKDGNPDVSVDGTYYILDLYSTDSADPNSGVLPNGTYKLTGNYQAGTFNNENSFCVSFKEGMPTWLLYTDGTVVVSDGKIEATITTLNEDTDTTEIHHVVYEGDLTWGNFDDGGNEGPVVPEEFKATHTATKWFSGGNDNLYGFKYAVAGEDFSLNVFFPTKFASANALAAGEYIWTITTKYGYNDFENEFTTKTLLVNGEDVAVDAGKALVEVEGDVYHIELTLLGRNNSVYMIQFDGKFNDAGSDDGGDSEPAEAVVFTKMEFLEYLSSYGIYKYRLLNDNNDDMLLFVNDYQADETLLDTGDTYQWISNREQTGNNGRFSTDYVKVSGTPFEPISGSMIVLTDTETRHMSISITLVNVEGEQVFTFNGKIGGEKLAAPVVTVEYTSGTTANVSWTAVEGAENYTLKINGGNENTTTGTTATLNDLAYGTTYTVSVVANPADSDVKASDAGTATFTTEADPNAGGDDNTGDDNTGGVSYENWNYSAHYDTSSAVVTLTGKDDSRVVTLKTNTLGFFTFYADTTQSNHFTNVTVDGVATTNVTTDSYINIQQTKVTISLVINGVTYTGDSNGFTF